MKRLILSAAFTTIAAFCLATVRTVSNNPGTIAQFSTIQAAINASVSGDTIYVHGSPITYDPVTITDKRICLMGPGIAPDKNIPYTASIPSFTINGSSGSSDFCELHGLLITNLTINQGVNNVRIIRNQFNGVTNFSNSIAMSNFLVESNIIYGQVSATGSGSISNFLFHNNIFLEFPAAAVEA